MMQHLAALVAPVLYLASCLALSMACAPAPGVAPPPAEGSAVRLLVSPPGSDGAPASADRAGTAALLEAIRGARTSVRLAMYLFSAPEALAALIEARAAGRRVEVLLERAPYGAEDGNDAAFAALATAGVEVRWVDAQRGLLHAKLLIVDGACAYVMTLNFTRSGLAGNREYAIADCAVADVRRAEAVWSAAAQGAAAPPTTAAASRLVASPWDARARIGAAIDGATSSIDIEMEELSDPGLAAKLEEAKRRGVQVTVVAPAGDRSPATDQTLARLAGAGVAVRVLAAPGIHAKAMVVDRRSLYVGSVNFTRASLDDNREVGFLADDPALAARLRATIVGDALRASPF